MDITDCIRSEAKFPAVEMVWKPFWLSFQVILPFIFLFLFHHIHFHFQFSAHKFPRWNVQHVEMLKNDKIPLLLLAKSHRLWQCWNIVYLYVSPSCATDYCAKSFAQNVIFIVVCPWILVDATHRKTVYMLWNL